MKHQDGRGNGKGHQDPSGSAEIVRSKLGFASPDTQAAVWLACTPPTVKLTVLPSSPYSPGTSNSYVLCAVTAVSAFLTPSKRASTTVPSGTGPFEVLTVPAK